MCDLTLGELLKRKAETGVRVLLMIWGETTSIMGTHDTETENFFKGATTAGLLTFDAHAENGNSIFSSISGQVPAYLSPASPARRRPASTRTWMRTSRPTWATVTTRRPSFWTGREAWELAGESLPTWVGLI